MKSTSAWERPRSDSVRKVLEPILADILRRGVHDEFQRGYAEAITWTWEQAGLPPTVEFMAARSLARAEYLSTG